MLRELEAPYMHMSHYMETKRNSRTLQRHHKGNKPHRNMQTQ